MITKLRKWTIVLISFGLVIGAQVFAQAGNPLPIFGGAEWHPTEDKIAFFTYDKIVIYDGNLQELYSLPIPMEASEVTETRISEIAWSPDGTKLAAVILRAVYEAGASRIVIWDITSSPATVIFNVDRPTGPITWSPDSQYIAGLVGVSRYLAIYDISGTLLQEGDIGFIPFSLDWHPTNMNQLALGSTSDELAARIVDPLAEGFPTIAEVPALYRGVGMMYSPDGTLYASIRTETGDVALSDTSWLFPGGYQALFAYNFGSLNIRNFDWLDTGIAIAYHDRTVRKFDPYNLELPVLIPIQDTTFMSLHWKPDGTKAVTISRESGIRVVDGDTGQVLAGINLDGTLLTPSALITNISVTGSTRTYTRQPNLAVGSTAYTDRVYTYKTVPSQYLGSEYIQTANDDKQTNPFSLNFTLTAPARVYVALDSRSGTTAWPVPSWLSTWQVDPQSVIIGDASMSITHRMYYKDFIAGNVSLGNNGALSPHMMYTVIAVPN